MTPSTSSQPIIRIVVDDRERSAAVLSALRAIGDVDLSVERLDIGDYSVGRNLLVERKTAADFSQSVVSGRLFRQAHRLSTCPGTLRLLVLEGSAADVRGAGLSLHALQGALISVTLVFGIPVLRTLSPYETAHLLVVAGRQLHRRARQPMRTQPRVQAAVRTTQLMMLIGVRGIGPVTAGRLLDHFGSIRSIATATVEDLTAVLDIGPKTARRLHWALNAKVL
jgi:ERCC4-type nuclease